MEILEVKNGYCLLIRYSAMQNPSGKIVDAVQKMVQGFTKDKKLQGVDYLIFPDDIQIDVLRAVEPEVQTKRFI